MHSPNLTIRNPSVISAWAHPSLQIRRTFASLPSSGQRSIVQSRESYFPQLVLALSRQLQLAVDDRLNVQTHPALRDREVHAKVVLIKNQFALMERLLLGLKVLGVRPTHYSGADRERNARNSVIEP